MTSRGRSLTPAVPWTSPADDRFDGFLVALVVHIPGAAAFTLLGVVQLTPYLRRRHRTWHRRSVRLTAAAGLAVAASALWLTLFIPPQPGTGTLLFVLRLVVAPALAASLVLGVAAIRRGDVTAHRAWMVRGYALGLGAGTQALTQGATEAVLGTGDLRLDIARGSAWLINLAVAEWAIRHPSRHLRGGQRVTSTARGEVLRVST